MKVLVTGGAGFIGSNLIRHILNSSDATLINIDKLSYAGNLESLKDIENHKNYKFIKADIANAKHIEEIILEEAPDTIMHLAAESHVDRSIENPIEFINSNILGTVNLVQSFMRLIKSSDKKDISNFCFHLISTDEVFGSLGEEGKFNESTPYDPKSPYSASKASADHIVRAWSNTFGLPYLITNCSNNYGSYQHPEKLIPSIILNAINKKTISIYGKGENIRDWLHVQDHAEALWQIVNSSKRNETYCIGSNNEKTNLDVVNEILDIMNKMCIHEKEFDLKTLIKFVDDRPGHDLRYAIDS